MDCFCTQYLNILVFSDRYAISCCVRRLGSVELGGLGLGLECFFSITSEKAFDLKQAGAELCQAKLSFS